MNMIDYLLLILFIHLILHLLINLLNILMGIQKFKNKEEIIKC